MTPQTAAGRALLERFSGLPDYKGDALRPNAVVAIEREAAAAALSRVRATLLAGMDDEWSDRDVDSYIPWLTIEDALDAAVQP